MRAGYEFSASIAADARTATVISTTETRARLVRRSCGLSAGCHWTAWLGLCSAECSLSLADQIAGTVVEAAELDRPKMVANSLLLIARFFTALVGAQNLPVRR